MKAILPRADTRPTQVGDMDPWPVTWPNLSDLIGWGQQISSTSWENHKQNFFHFPQVIKNYFDKLYTETMSSVTNNWYAYE